MTWTTIHTHPKQQWQVQTNEDGDYRVINPAADGRRQYYQAFSGKYGEPLIEPEPDLAVPCPSGCRYTDVSGEESSPDQRISGLIVKREDGSVVHRVSLTNALNKGIEWELDHNGVLTIDGEQFHLQTLVIKDGNRVRNYDAFFGTGTPESVKVLELQDLINVID
jgi:hypothetical protein